MEETGLVKSESGQLLQMAIEKDLDVDKLKALMDLRDREDRRKAEREFEDCFAAMQRDYIPAYKSKDVSTVTGKIAYSYCPLPKILSVYAPILAKHGFSYRWEESEIDGKLEKKTTCFLSGHGFTRQASISLPYGATNNLINPIQARGATSEYGRRYTFMNVTGCIVADDTDTDGITEPKEPGQEGAAPETPAPADPGYTILAGSIPEDYKEKKSEYKAKGYGCKQFGKDWKWVRYGNTPEQTASAPAETQTLAPTAAPDAKADTKLSTDALNKGIAWMNEMNYSPVIQKARITWGNTVGNDKFLANIQKDHENFLSKKLSAAVDAELPY